MVVGQQRQAVSSTDDAEEGRRIITPGVGITDRPGQQIELLVMHGPVLAHAMLRLHSPRCHVKRSGCTGRYPLRPYPDLGGYRRPAPWPGQ